MAYVIFVQRGVLSTAGMDFGAVTGSAVGWRAATACVFASGVLFLALGAFRLGERIFEAIRNALP